LIGNLLGWLWLHSAPFSLDYYLCSHLPFHETIASVARGTIAPEISIGWPVPT
jgi:hypothetical protein